MPRERRFPKEGFKPLTLQLSPGEQEDLAVLRRLMGGRTTKVAAVRSAIRRARWLLEAQEQRDKEIALVDKDGKSVVVTFLM